jgi:hypothetical protein
MLQWLDGRMRISRCLLVCRAGVSDLVAALIQASPFELTCSCF